MVVVTYRSAATLAACLASLRRAAADLPRVVVVDNASDDGSAAIAEAAQVGVIRRPDNGGYGLANNAGVRELGDIDVVVFANPDSVWPVGSIDALVQELEADPAIGLLSPVLVDDRGLPQPIVERDFGLGAVLLSLVRLRRPIRPRTPQFCDGPLLDVEWLHTAAAVLPQATVAAVGGFDERFFLFAEDADLCRRVRDHGQRVVITANVRVAHVGGVSFEASYDQNGSAALRTRALATYLEKYQGNLARRTFGAVGAVVYGMGRHRGQAREAWKAATR